MKPSGGLKKLEGYKKREVRADNFFKGVYTFLDESRKRIENDNSFRAIESLESAADILEAVFGSQIEVVEEARFDAWTVVSKAIVLSKRLEEEDLTKRFEEMHEDLIWQFKMFEGSLYRDKEEGENFEILEASLAGYWIATIQKEDGTFSDKNLEAVIKGENYQFVEVRDRPEERICKNHSFTNSGICEKCKLSARSLTELGAGIHGKCDECGEWVTWIIHGGEDIFECPECGFKKKV
jgi:hypothetical protein